MLFLFLKSKVHTLHAKMYEDFSENVISMNATPLSSLGCSRTDISTAIQQ